MRLIERSKHIIDLNIVKKYEHTINYPQLNLKHRNESLCLFAYSVVQHIMYCVFALFCLCSCCQFLWIVLFLLPL